MHAGEGRRVDAREEILMYSTHTRYDQNAMSELAINRELADRTDRGASV